MWIRPAEAADEAAIEALMSPEIAAGRLLPRPVELERTLVAARGGHLAGAVSLAPLSGEVAAAARAKAGADCAACPRLGRCTQWLVARPVAAARARCA